MIEKKIHYIWFGKNELPPLAKKCIESWKKYCPDYEIIEWNEDNFDVMSNIYTKEAYENKKWAFVSDYVRLYALYHVGGVYMDTDVEVIKNIDSFLENEAFSGFESYDKVPTGIMAAEKGNKHIKKMLEYYDDKHFVMENGELDMTTNVTTITNYFKEHNIKLNNTYQNCDGFVFYPSDYFCPKDPSTKKLNMTKNTATIHHFDGSWIPKGKKIKYKILNKMNKNFIRKCVLLKNKIKNIFK